MQLVTPYYYPRMETTMNAGNARPGKTAGMLAAASLAIALSASWLGTATAAGPGDPAQRQQRFEQMQTRMKARIAKMGERLEIKASQEAAWNDYAKSREAMFAQRPARPARDADAATVARSRAEFAADMARKLAVVSDSTAKLQSVLDDNQKKTFNQLAQRSGKRGHREERGESPHREGGRGSHERSPR